MEGRTVDGEWGLGGLGKTGGEVWLGILVAVISDQVWHVRLGTPPPAPDPAP